MREFARQPDRLAFRKQQFTQRPRAKLRDFSFRMQASRNKDGAGYDQLPLIRMQQHFAHMHAWTAAARKQILLVLIQRARSVSQGAHGTACPSWAKCRCNCLVIDVSRCSQGCTSKGTARNVAWEIALHGEVVGGCPFFIRILEPMPAVSHKCYDFSVVTIRPLKAYADAAFHHRQYVPRLHAASAFFADSYEACYEAA